MEIRTGTEIVTKRISGGQIRKNRFENRNFDNISYRNRNINLVEK